MLDCEEDVVVIAVLERLEIGGARPGSLRVAKRCLK